MRGISHLIDGLIAGSTTAMYVLVFAVMETIIIFASTAPLRILAVAPCGAAT